MITEAETVIESQDFDILRASEDLPGPGWLTERRKLYVDKAKSAGFPTTDEEIWRYTDINSFDLNDYRPVGLTDIGEPVAQESPDVGVMAAEVGVHSGLVVTKNGKVVHHSLNPEIEKLGVVVTSILEAQGFVRKKMLEYLGTIAAETADTFVWLNEAMCVGGVYIHVPSGVEISDPIVVIHLSEGDDVAVFDRLFVHVEKSSLVSIIERFESSDKHIFLNSVTECLVEDNAHVKFLTTQENGHDTTHIGINRTHIYRDARYESSIVSLGGKYARLRGEVVLLGENSSSDVMAVYYGDREQLLDFRTLQDHVAKNATSNLLFKGAVEDTARSVYSGMVHIREFAQGTQAYQTNHNLILDHGAHCESIPNLIIEASDVTCSHGSTVGEIDENQMYYLATRGVSPKEAEKLIILGFFEDVFSRLSIPALVEPLRKNVDAKLISFSGHHEDETE